MSETSETIPRPGARKKARKTRGHWLARATACSLCWLFASISPSWATDGPDQALAEDNELELTLTEDEQVEPIVADEEGLEAAFGSALECAKKALELDPAYPA